MIKPRRKLKILRLGNKTVNKGQLEPINEVKLDFGKYVDQRSKFSHTILEELKEIEPELKLPRAPAASKFSQLMKKKTSVFFTD